MSGDGQTETTEDELVAMYDNMFKDRYTDRDPDYVETMKKPLSPPPCVQNWFCKRKRGSHDNWGGRSGRGEHHGRGNWSRGSSYGRGGPSRFDYHDNRQRDSYGPSQPPPRPYYGGYRGRGDWRGPPPGPRWGGSGAYGSRYQPY